MEHIITMPDVRERTAVDVVVFTERRSAPGTARPSIRAVTHSVESAVCIGGRQFAESSVPASCSLSVAVDASGMEGSARQPSDPEEIAMALPATGRWVASEAASSVNLDSRLTEWYSLPDLPSQNYWTGVGDTSLLVSRGASTPAFGYLAGRRWVPCDAVEIRSRAALRMRHEPWHGEECAMVCIGSFDRSGASGHVVIGADIGDSRVLSLFYDKDSTLSLLNSDGWPYGSMPNPSAPGSLCAMILFHGRTDDAIACVTLESAVSCSLGRSAAQSGDLRSWTMSTSSKSSSRIVEVDMFQSDNLSRESVTSQARALLAYYSRRSV